MADFGDLGFDINFEQNIGVNSKMASRFYCDRAGTVNSINCYSVAINAGSHVQAAIYADVAGSPGALLGVSNVITPYNNDYHNFTCAIALPAPGYYWIALLNDNSSFAFGNQFCKVTVAANVVRNANTFGSGFSDPFGAPTVGVNQLSIFANFTPDLDPASYVGEITGGIDDDGGANQYKANTVTVFKVTAATAATITEMVFYLKAAHPGAKVTGVVYDATGMQLGVPGFPGNLIAETDELVSPQISGNTLTFATPFELPAAGDYYIGIITDTQMFDFTRADVAGHNYQVAAAYASGAPGIYPQPYVAYGFLPTLWVNFAGSPPPPPPPPPPPCSTYSGTANAVRLVPFKFNTLQAYALELGDHYMRVIRNGAMVLEPEFAISAATISSPLVLTAVGNDFAVGDWVFIQDVDGMTQLNNTFFIVGNTLGDNITLTDLDGNAINSSAGPNGAYSPYISGGTIARVFTLATPWAAADLALLKFTQSNDVMTFTHVLYPSYDLTRTQHWVWTLTQVTFAATVQEPTVAGTVGQNAVAGNPPLWYRYQITSVIDDTGEESIGCPPSGQFANTALDQTKGCQNVIGITPPSSGPLPDRYNLYKADPVGDDGGNPGGPQDIFGYIGQTTTNRFVDTNIAADFTRTPPLHRDPFANGPITEIKVTAGGGGYFDGSFGAPPDSITLTDPTGSGWEGFLNFEGGAIVSVTTTNPGHDYTAPVAVIHTSTGAGATFAIKVGALTGNYPGCVTYSQQRKVFAGSLNGPDTGWATQTGNFTNMDVSVPVRDSDAITFTLASNQVNAIQHLIDVQTGLVAFTDNAPWLINGGSSGAAITPSSIDANEQAVNGCSHTLPPIKITSDVLFVQYGDAIVRNITYNFYTNIFAGTDLTVLSNHLFFGFKLVEWTYAEQPFKLIWAVRDNGVLLSCTYLKEQEIIGWAHHDTDGCFQSICSIPEGDEQAVYMAVERKIPGVNGGDPVIYIERFASRNFLVEGEPDLDRCWFVDSGLRYEGAPATQIVGLDHLLGKDVVGLADGNFVGPLTVQRIVVDGIYQGIGVTLQNAAASVTLGLPYTAQLQTLRIDVGEPTIQDKGKTLPICTLRVDNERGLKVGRDFVTMDELEERDPDQPWGTPIPLFTGDRRAPLESGWDRLGQICIQQDYPLPATVLGVIPWLWVGDTPG